MKKSLSDMTLEELWQLFPIFLVEPSEYWDAWFVEEKQNLQNILPSDAHIHIHHIGSTAIKGIWAKPIIDILIDMPFQTNIVDIKSILINNGYTCMSEEKTRISLNKGYTVDGFAEKVFHLHLRYEGDDKEIYFRDYLNAHPTIAKQYEQLKLSLWKKYEHDRDGYTAAKTEFILLNTKKSISESSKC